MFGTDSTDTSIFEDLSAEKGQIPYEVESLCPNCQENGLTKLICLRIPFYRQVIVMSFSCEKCGCRNNELQSAEPIQEHGTEICLSAKEPIDLNRQIVKSEYAEIEIPELELIIPARSQPGEISTVEGVLQKTRAGLLQDQEKRKEVDPENAAKINNFITRLDDLIALRRPFTFKLRDASGNSFIQNPNPCHVDPRSITVHYNRSLTENKMLGLADDDQKEEEPVPEWKSFEDVKNEVLRIPTDCPNCGVRTETCIKPTDIPYFSTVIIMATTCDVCGVRTNEVKSAGAIRDRGVKLTVAVEKVGFKQDVDLARDVLKSDTCHLTIPELELDVGPGALSARFTTVEGLLIATKEQLKEQGRFFFGDSATADEKSEMTNFLRKFDEILRLERMAHIILDDPAGNSYIQSLAAPLEDARLKKEFYVRTYEQNDELGLNDMKTEHYEPLEALDEENEEVCNEKSGN